jgi:hypothetical protein
LFFALNPFPTFLKESVGASILGLFYRYWPWWLLFFSTYNLNQDVNRQFRRLTLISGIVGIFASFILDLGWNEFHFYHIGLFCVLLSVSCHFLAIQRRRVLSRGAIVCLIVGCVLPIWGNGFMPELGGYEEGGSTPQIRSTELDSHLYAAYVFIKRHSSATDLVLTARDRVESPSLGKNSFNFFASAFTERQIFLEGWGFSKFSKRKADQNDYISKQTAQRDAFYSSPDLTSGEAALQKIKPQWIVWDQRINGDVPIWLEQRFSKGYDFGPVTVLQTDFSSAIHEQDVFAGRGS